MGWRKPVPVFVPTPPSSRPTSDTLTSASGFSGGDAGKGPKDGLPPVSPLPRYPRRAESELTPSKMPDDWLSIVRSFSQDFYHDSSRFRLAVGTAIPERQPVYAVCQLCSSGISPAAQRLFSRSFPGLCLRRRIIIAPILLGHIMCRGAPYPGHVVISLSCLALLIFLLP